MLARVPAVRLFVERAGAVRPEFRLTADVARAVAEICARLDGLPLAIELAAARADVQTPAEILAGLQRNSLDLLAGGAGDLPPRQRTLRDAVAWSEALLPAAERVLFRRLSVFASGCTLDGAAAVAGDGATRPELAARMDALVRQSLLQRRDDRYRMLETIRACARESLQASGDAAEAARRHSAYYLSLAETAAPLLHGAEQIEWLDRLEAERDELRTALAWCVAAGRAEPPAGPGWPAPGQRPPPACAWRPPWAGTGTCAATGAKPSPGSTPCSPSKGRRTSPTARGRAAAPPPSWSPGRGPSAPPGCWPSSSATTVAPCAASRPPCGWRRTCTTPAWWPARPPAWATSTCTWATSRRRRRTCRWA